MPGMSVGYYCKGSQEMHKWAMVRSVSITKLSKLVRQCCQTQHLVLFFLFFQKKVRLLQYILL